MIAIVLATRQEASPLLAQAKLEPIHDAAFAMYRLQDCDGLVLICGPGPLAAAAAMRYLFDNHAVQQVLNIGICGALVDSATPHGLYRISAVCDGDAAQSAASISLASDMFADLPTATLASVSEAVFDTKRRDRLAAYAMLVDMEGVAIAEVCREKGIPCCLVKGVSDRADAEGRRAIRRNLSAISRRLADRAIAELGWPQRKTGRLAVFGKFVRIEHTVLSIPLILAGAWLGAGNRAPSLLDVLLLTLVAAGARTLGMAMNRILDRDLDALNPRTLARDLPAGRIGLSGAYTVAALGLLMYLAGCAALGPLCLALSPIPVIPLLAYSFLKRFTCLCHFGIGLCLAIGPAGAYVATSGELPLHAGILLLTGFTFAWISGFDIIYALQDLEFDRAHGVHSLPAVIGSPAAQLIAAVTHLAGAAALVLLWQSVGGRMAGIALALSLLATVTAYIQSIPTAVRFFPISAVAGIAGALVVLLGGSS